jgi:hypothetical protein
MMHSIPGWLLLAICLAGCGRREARSSNCQWPAETAAPLDLNLPAERQHLADDAILAEDLAVRFADAHWGQRSGHFEGFGVYGRERDRCMAGLFEAVGKNHGVTPAQVRLALTYRRTGFDLAVLLSFAALYGLGAFLVARRICQRFPLAEGRGLAVLVTIIASVLISLGGVMVGEEWSLATETYRIGNDHLSYRVNRIPWNSHRPELFLGGVVLFWAMAGFCYRKGAGEGERPLAEGQIPWKAL